MSTHKLERHVVARASGDNRSITLLRVHKNSQTWYDIEIDRWVQVQVEVTVKDMLDFDSAFDFYERYIETHNMEEK